MVRIGPLVLLVLLVTAPAAGAERCSQLDGRDLAPATHVRIVVERFTDGSRSLSGCILPRGPVRSLGAEEAYETGSDDFTLLRVRREFVMVENGGFTQYGGVRQTSVTDIRSGRSYRIASYCTGMICPPERGNGGLARALLTNTGEVVAAYSHESATRIAAFTAWGDERTLDRGEIPAASLRLRGRTASWTHAGELRSAEI